MKQENYDYIIIGGGLAGSVLGYLLNKEKCKVLVVEKNTIKSKNKLCGGILTNKAYNMLCTIFDDNQINKIIEKEYTQVPVFSKYDINIDNNLKIIDRKKLDNYILNEYIKNNGIVFDNTKIEEINIQENYIVFNSKKRIK